MTEMTTDKSGPVEKIVGLYADDLEPGDKILRVTPEVGVDRVPLFEVERPVAPGLGIAYEPAFGRAFPGLLDREGIFHFIDPATGLLRSYEFGEYASFRRAALA